MPWSSISRRAGLATAALLPSASVAQSRGPAVWLDLDQAALDAAYDQAAYAANLRQIVDRYASASALTRVAIGAPTRAAYGAAPIEALDIFRARAAAPAPVLIFLHGGAWRSGLARDYAFPAECLCRAGAHFVVPDFSWVQDQGGDLMPIADQVRRAIAWVWRNAARFGGDPAQVFVAGHSSGAHLAAVALTTDWSVMDVPADVLKGGVLVSGLYDLKPARLSARSRYVAFTDASEHALSPQRHLAHLRAPVVVLHGDLETPEFQRQSRDFAAAVAAAGQLVEALRALHTNHFETIETLANPYGLAGRAALRMMGIAAA